MANVTPSPVAGANEWQPIESAPKDRPILVFGTPSTLIDSHGNVLLKFVRPAVHQADWDEIDQAFCLDGGSWLGPFIKPTHWMSLPEPPS